MKKILVILLIVIIGALFIFNYRKHKDPYGPGTANINLEYFDTQLYDANWSLIKDIIDSLMAMGYMKIKINDFEYHYYCYCAECEGINYQGNDLLILDEDNLKPLHDWCERNKGKFAQVSFDDYVDFDVVTEVVKTLNTHEIKIDFGSNTDQTEDIKIDLYPYLTYPVEDKK